MVTPEVPVPRTAAAFGGLGFNLSLVAWLARNFRVAPAIIGYAQEAGEQLKARNAIAAAQPIKAIIDAVAPVIQDFPGFADGAPPAADPNNPVGPIEVAYMTTLPACSTEECDAALQSLAPEVVDTIWDVVRNPATLQLLLVVLRLFGIRI